MPWNTFIRSGQVSKRASSNGGRYLSSADDADEVA